MLGTIHTWPNHRDCEFTRPCAVRRFDGAALIPFLANHFNSVDKYFKISGLVIWWRWPTILTFIAPTALPMKAARKGSLPLATRGAAKAKKASPAPIVSIASPINAGMRFTPPFGV